MKRHEERIRANRSAKSTVNQTQNPAPDPKRRLIYVKVPKSWLPAIDQAAAAMGHSRTSFFTEAVRAAIEAGKDAIIDRQHQANAGTVTVDQVGQAPASVPDYDLDLARAHCNDQMMRALKKGADEVAADLCAFSDCIFHHPGLRKEYQAFRKLGSGLLKIVNLSVAANEKTSNLEYAKLSAGERWAGVYFPLITDVSLESFMPNLEGLGDILLCSPEMAALGNALKEMEESYAFLCRDFTWLANSRQPAATSEGGAK